jgi:hypothetical protein
MQPVELLNALKQVGVFLLPSERDAAFVDVIPKEPDTERAMCNDVASLAGSHLIASSKWTQFVKVGIKFGQPSCNILTQEVLPLEHCRHASQ